MAKHPRAQSETFDSLRRRVNAAVEQSGRLRNEFIRQSAGRFGIATPQPSDEEGDAEERPPPVDPPKPAMVSLFFEGQYYRHCHLREREDGRAEIVVDEHGTTRIESFQSWSEAKVRWDELVPVARLLLDPSP